PADAAVNPARRSPWLVARLRTTDHGPRTTDYGLLGFLGPQHSRGARRYEEHEEFGSALGLAPRSNPGSAKGAPRDPGPRLCSSMVESARFQFRSRTNGEIEGARTHADGEIGGALHASRADESHATGCRHAGAVPEEETAEDLPVRLLALS